MGLAWTTRYDSNMHAKKSPEGLPRETLIKMQKIANIMDRAFVIPGTGIRFGIDPILGLIPGIGDTLSVVASGYIYSHAKQAGVPWRQRLAMLWNIFMDWLIGLVPVIGDLFDVSFKANSRNIAIIRSYAESELNNHTDDTA